MSENKNKQIQIQSPRIEVTPITRAQTDIQIMDSWLDSLGSDRTRKNFQLTAEAFLSQLECPLRQATVEDVRDAINAIIDGKADSTAKQYTLRVKSLLTYAKETGYTQFNVGAAIKVRVNRQQTTKRTPSEVDVSLLIRAAKTPRDRVLLQVMYAGGLRVDEITKLCWADVTEKGDEVGRVMISVTGKGDKERTVLLPAVVSRALLKMRGDAGQNDAIFVSRKTGGPITTRAIQYVVKQAAEAAGVDPKLSPHWLRHGHATHALRRGATLADVRDTLGHGDISTTSGYLGSDPDRSSGLVLDDGVWLR